jgi:hypothetical protein
MIRRDNHAPTEVEALRQTFRVGARVRFLGFGEDEPIQLAVGSMGTVLLVDSMGTVHVNWDSGVILGMIVRSLARRSPDRIVPLGGGPTAPPVT